MIEFLSFNIIYENPDTHLYSNNTEQITVRKTNNAVLFFQNLFLIFARSLYYDEIYHKICEGIFSITLTSNTGAFNLEQMPFACKSRPN